jgi:hypothetical protein
VIVSLVVYGCVTAKYTNTFSFSTNIQSKQSVLKRSRFFSSGKKASKIDQKYEVQGGSNMTGTICV